MISPPGVLLNFCRRCTSINTFSPQMKPTGCTLLLSMFISSFLHVSGNCVPIIRRTHCTYATLVLFTVYGWLFGLLVGIASQPADRTATHTQWTVPVSHRFSEFSWRWAHSCPKHVEKTRQPTIQSEQSQCRIDTVSSSDDGHIVARNM